MYSQLWYDLLHMHIYWFPKCLCPVRQDVAKTVWDAAVFQALWDGVTFLYILLSMPQLDIGVMVLVELVGLWPQSAWSTVPLHTPNAGPDVSAVHCKGDQITGILEFLSFFSGRCIMHDKVILQMFHQCRPTTEDAEMHIKCMPINCWWLSEQFCKRKKKSQTNSVLKTVNKKSKIHTTLFTVLYSGLVGEWLLQITMGFRAECWTEVWVWWFTLCILKAKGRYGPCVWTLLC